MYALKSGKQQITQFITDIKTAYTFVDKEEKIS
jgi:hypothetical protein